MWTFEKGERGKYLIVRRMEGQPTDVIEVVGQDALDEQIRKMDVVDYTIEVYMVYPIHESK